MDCPTVSEVHIIYSFCRQNTEIIWNFVTKNNCVHIQHFCTIHARFQGNNQFNTRKVVSFLV